MIQRIQTIYLLVITALMAVMIFMPHAFPFRDKMVSLLLMVLAALLPFVIIFFYKKRRIQVRLCIVEIILLLGVQVCAAFSVVCHPGGFSACTIPGIFPLVGVLLACLALRAIIRDERLVRSADRIR